MEFFSPTRVIAKVAQVEPAVARIIFAGLGLLAIVAIAATWKVDSGTALALAVAVTVVAIIIILAANVLRDDSFGRFVGRAIIGLLLVYLLALVVAIIFPNNGFLPRVSCMVYVLEPCEGTIQRISNEQAANAPPKTVAEIDQSLLQHSGATAPAAFAEAAKYRVDIQYGGALDVATIKTIAAQLKSVGWRVAAESGEKLITSTGLNEVRYGAGADKEAAAALAAKITAMGKTGRDLVVKYVPIIKGGNLEVWISK